MAVSVYLNFRGNCREAVNRYAEIFNTESPRFMTFGDMPPDPENPIAEKDKPLILHTNILVQGTLLMFSDTPDWMEFKEGNNMSLVLGFKDEAELRACFDSLADGGEVTMPVGPTFFSPCYGMVTDRFGIQWQVSLDTPPAAAP